MNALIIGAARTGIAAAKLLIDQDINVTLTDTKKEEEIEDSLKEDFNELKKSPNFNFFLNQQYNPDVLNFDLIIPSPGVPDTIPVLVKAQEKKIPIISEPELAYRYSKTPFIGITGTNGKTTTTSLLGYIFKNSPINAYIVGNIGNAISNYVSKANSNDIFITELGSFQLEKTKSFKPKGAIITNITPDHLDRHKTMENYINAKSKIFNNQDKNDFLILNADDKIVKNLAKNNPVEKYYFSTKNKIDQGAYLDGNRITLNIDNQIIPLINDSELRIKGNHNIQNAMAASLAAYLYGIDLNIIKESLKSFKPVEHRLEPVGVFNQIEYINDSKATNTDAAITAINAFKNPIILIAGGYDKKEDYTKLAKLIKEKVKFVSLLGETKNDLKEAFLKEDFTEFDCVETFEEAVKLANDKAEPGDIVLLSPACASWDMFKNFEIRGNEFRNIVQKLNEEKNWNN